MNSPHASLIDPPAESAIAVGMAWVETTALGNVATAIAIVAVAAIGLLMLSGRLELRRGLTVVLGCFMLFGAASVGAALTGLGRAEGLPRAAYPPTPSPLPRAATATDQSLAAYDPYAGASVPLRQ